MHYLAGGRNQEIGDVNIRSRINQIFFARDQFCKTVMEKPEGCPWCNLSKTQTSWCGLADIFNLKQNTFKCIVELKIKIPMRASQYHVSHVHGTQCFILTWD